MALHHGGVIENRLRLICFKIGLNIGSKFLASNLSHTWTSWLAHRASSVSIISRCLLLRFYRTDKVGISRKDMSKKAHLVYRFLSFAGVLALLFGLQYLLTNSRRTCTSTSAKPYIYKEELFVLVPSRTGYQRYNMCQNYATDDRQTFLKQLQLHESLSC